MHATTSPTDKEPSAINLNIVANSQHTPDLVKATQVDGVIEKSGTGTRRRGQPVTLWSCEDVNRWLLRRNAQLHNLYAPIFVKHEITGGTLQRLNDWKLQMIGISERTHRESLLRLIVQLNLKQATADLRALHQKVAVLPKDKSVAVLPKDKSEEKRKAEKPESDFF